MTDLKLVGITADSRLPEQFEQRRDAERQQAIDGALSELAAVARSGSYVDLADRPTIPTTPGQVGADPAGSAVVARNQAVAAAQAYTDTAVAAEQVDRDAAVAAAIQRILGGVPPEQLDTILELVAAFQAEQGELDGLAATVAGKQAASATLSLLAALTTTDLGRTLLTLATAAEVRTQLGLGGAATLNVGGVAGTVAAGNDGRLTNQRVPTDGSVTTAKINNATLADLRDGTKLTGLGAAALLGVGTGPNTVAAGDDPRLADARTPALHAASHKTGGTDALKAADVGASVQTIKTFEPGAWWSPSHGGTTGTTALGSGTAFFWPFYFPAPMVLETFRAEVTAVAGSTLRTALYPSLPSGLPDRAGKLLDSTELFDASVGGFKDTAGNGLLIPAGIVWVGLLGQGSANTSIRTISNAVAAGLFGMPLPTSYTPGTNAALYCLTLANQATATEMPKTGTGWNNPAGTGSPRVWFKAAA